VWQRCVVHLRLPQAVSRMDAEVLPWPTARGHTLHAKPGMHVRSESTAVVVLLVVLPTVAQERSGCLYLVPPSSHT